MVGFELGRTVQADGPLKHLQEIQKAIGIPVVLHGGSGIRPEDIKEGIACGISKININTEVRLAFSQALRKTLEANKSEITPYKYLNESIAAAQAVVEEKMKEFGSENKI